MFAARFDIHSSCLDIYDCHTLCASEDVFTENHFHHVNDYFSLRQGKTLLPAVIRIGGAHRHRSGQPQHHHYRQGRRQLFKGMRVNTTNGEGFAANSGDTATTPSSPGFSGADTLVSDAISAWRSCVRRVQSSRSRLLLASRNEGRLGIIIPGRSGFGSVESPVGVGVADVGAGGVGAGGDGVLSGEA